MSVSFNSNESMYGGPGVPGNVNPSSAAEEKKAPEEVLQGPIQPNTKVVNDVALKKVGSPEAPQSLYEEVKAEIARIKNENPPLFSEKSPRVVEARGRVSKKLIEFFNGLEKRNDGRFMCLKKRPDLPTRPGEPTKIEDIRSMFTDYYSWSIPGEAALQVILTLSKENGIVEMGAGLGLWAACLKEAGGDVVAFDNAINENNTYGKFQLTGFFKVKWGTPIFLDPRLWDDDLNLDNRYLLLSWPHFNSDLAEKCLKYFTGDIIFYIGEHRSGCCATDEFFDEIEKEFEMEIEIPIPRWGGFSDSLYIYVRKNRE